MMLGNDDEENQNFEEKLRVGRLTYYTATASFLSIAVEKSDGWRESVSESNQKGYTISTRDAEEENEAKLTMK